jgi:hypothetical protein
MNLACLLSLNEVGIHAKHSHCTLSSCFKFGEDFMEIVPGYVGLLDQAKIIT